MPETRRPARTDVIRSLDFQLIRAGQDQASDGLTLEGYAAVFDAPTDIDSWEGTFTEQIRRGAFRRTIQQNTPVLQFDHGRHPLIGSIPIGAIEDLREDDQGLYVQARLSDNWLMQPLRDAIAQRSITGMSFRFEVIRDEWRDKNGVILTPVELDKLLWKPGDRGPLARTLIEVRLRELGPVVFPAYTGTSVDVRAREIAERIATDPHEARRSLAAGAPASISPDDPGLRRDVARALLFGAATAAPAAAPAAREQLLDAERAAELRARISGSVDHARQVLSEPETYTQQLAQWHEDGRDGFPQAPRRTAPARPTTEEAARLAAGLTFSVRDERRRASELEHKARRARADREIASHERLHASLRRLFGADEADRLMSS